MVLQIANDMRKIFCLLLISTSFVMFSQSKEDDFFIFYKGGNKYKKPVKYVLFDISNEYERKKSDDKIYFYMSGQAFIFNSKAHKIDTLAIDNLKKYQLENPENLQKKASEFYKEKKTVEEKRMNLKRPIMYPPTDFCKYFRIFVLEKTDQNRLLKYEVDWQFNKF